MPKILETLWGRLAPQNAEPSVRSHEKAAALMPHILRIVELYSQYAPEEYRGFQAAFRVDPSVGQTEESLYLVFPGLRQPPILRTPFGELQFSFANPTVVELGKFMEHLETRVVSSGEEGVAHAIHAVDGVELPEPKLRSEHSFIPPIEAALSLWSLLSKAIEAAKVEAEAKAEAEADS